MTTQFSFHDIPADMQHVVLASRKSVGEHLGCTGGFAGRIHRFATGTTEACAKVPLAKCTPKVAATRFLRELRLQRTMYYHQFVHWPFDFDLVHDTPVAWFRFWHSDLADLIEDAEFTFEGRLAMLAYIATALAHCHSMGLVAHQDLKPENIFVRDLKLDFAGLSETSVWRIPKLADFGSANLANECGEFGGTKAYMAPEQWNRTPLGQHTSVWSLGLIAYELLTFGHHPIGEPTRPWRNRAPGVFNRWQRKRMWQRWLQAGCLPSGTVGDEEADALIGRCLETNPALRPTIADFIGSMLAILKRRSVLDEAQARFRIIHADHESRSDHAWPYLDTRYNSVVSEIAEWFNDPSILDDYLISEGETAEMARGVRTRDAR